MVQNINLKELEKNTWTSFFQNGLIDIQIGLIFVVASICMICSDIRYYLMFLYLVPGILFILAKKYIVAPRMGIVKFSSGDDLYGKYLFGQIPEEVSLACRRGTQ